MVWDTYPQNLGEVCIRGTAWRLEGRKVMLEPEVAMTVSKEGSEWGTLALGGICILGVSRATPDANIALSISPSNNLNSRFWMGATGPPSGSKSNTPPGKAGAWSSGSLSRRSLQHNDAHAPRRQRTSTPSSSKLAHAQSPISPQATAHYLARGMGLGKWRGGLKAGGAFVSSECLGLREETVN